MFDREDNCRSAKDCVDARSENTNPVIMIFDPEINVRAFTAADPITLTLDYFVRPAAFDLLYICDEFFGIIRDAQVPLLDFLLRHLRATAPTDSARRLLIRQHRFFFRTPVNCGRSFVSEAAF